MSSNIKESMFGSSGFLQEMFSAVGQHVNHFLEWWGSQSAKSVLKRQSKHVRHLLNAVALPQRIILLLRQRKWVIPVTVV